MTLDLAHIVLISLSTALYLLLLLERHRAHKRETEYMRAVLARDLHEFDNSPEAQLAAMAKESELAKDAYNLQKLDQFEEPHHPV